MKLLYEYEKMPIGIQIKLETAGDLANLTAAVGRLMGQLYFNLPPFERMAFRAACQAMTKDDSPIWKPEEGIKIDLAALERQRGEQ